MVLSILADFDGTVTYVDTGMLVLEKFARGNWKIYDARLEKGEISIEECMNSQLSLVGASKEEIVKNIDFKQIRLRRNFCDLISFCDEHKIFLEIVSAGLDFCINRILKINGIDSLRVVSPKTGFLRNGIKLSFPKLRDTRMENFKEDEVVFRKRKGKVVYLGDGTSDLHAACRADMTFAVAGSSLARLCRKSHFECKEFTNFKTVIDAVQRFQA